MDSNARKTNSIKLSPTKTIGDWNAIKPMLIKGADSGIWEEVLRDFYYERLRARYLDPIKAINAKGTSKGEGFAIVAIQCSLIEFLESCFQGINYKLKNPAPPHEYNKSGAVFVSFLTERDPFKGKFGDGLAKGFYESVRCGVLHEARTKGTWLIHAKSASSIMIDPAGPILYRDNFQEAIIKFIENYRAAVPRDNTLQQAFIRKFDHLYV